MDKTCSCLSRILKACFSPKGSGDSSAEAGINIGSNGGGNSDSHNLTDQIHNTGNRLSSIHDAQSSPRGGGGSSAEAGINIEGGGGGNFDSHNLTDQIHNTGNSLSRIHRAHSLPPGVDPSSRADNIRGDYSGNSGSQNQFNSNNITYNYGMDPSDKEADILRCLYKSSYESHRGRIREPAEGTCTWVTEHQKYKDWSEKEKSGLLWLSADPGCGKSVTASFLITHLKTRTDAIVCYFFFKDDSDEQRSPTFALCSLLHQLFTQRNSLCKYAEQEFKSKDKKFTEDVSTLWDILVKAVAEGGCGEVICVVDALDEEDEIRDITADVTRVIDEGVENLESVWGSPGSLGYLRELLRSKADRTFLWVSLILELLQDSADGSRAGLVKIVSTAPASLDELYIEILSKSRDLDKACRILNIVVAAARPLTLTEMNIALTIRWDHKSMRDLRGDLYPRFEKTVKDLCGLFVRVIDSKIYLVHQTAREFLYKGSSPGQENWQYTLYPEDSSFVMADICFSYLSLNEFENDPLVIDTSNIFWEQALNAYLEKYAFLDYAAKHWADHFRGSQDQQTELFELTRQICEAGSKRFLTWLQVYWSGARPLYQCPKDLTHLMIASQLGLGTVVEWLLEEGGDINARSEEYGTALNIAAIKRDKVITRMLLQKNVKAYLSKKEYNILQTKKSELSGLLIIVS